MSLFHAAAQSTQGIYIFSAVLASLREIFPRSGAEYAAYLYFLCDLCGFARKKETASCLALAEQRAINFIDFYISKSYFIEND